MHQHKVLTLTRSLVVALGASLGLGAALPLQAQSYPVKPVRIIVGVPPGGFTDSVARFITPKLVETLGQQFTVEHPEVVADRMERWANAVGRENVLFGNDCGFASTAGNAEIPPSVAWAKLAALGDGARLATLRLWK